MRALVVAAALLAAVLQADPATEFAALLKDSESTQLGHREAYLAFKEKFEAFAKAHPGTEEGVTAKLWLLGNTRWHKEDQTMETRAAALAEEILAEAPKSPQLARIPDLHYAFAAKDRIRIFTRILEVSPHPEAKGAALLRLALASNGDERKGMLERLRKEFAEVPYHYGTCGEIADAHLNPHPSAALEVGKSAPEIVGRDADGKPMKLSDFRGRVVVLDFFGDW